MGSVGLGTNAELGAFLNRLYPEGLDLGRCQINQALGVFVADPAQVFRAGSPVMRGTTGLVIPSDGSDFLGVAKWNHTSAVYAAVVDEAVVLNATDTTPLLHGVVSNLRVASAVKGGGTIYTGGAVDYSVVSAANGTIARAGGGAIVDGQTVYVTYTFQVPEADLLTMQGKNFWNSYDEVSQNDYRVTVITDADLIFTSQYDTADLYTLTGATSNVYAGGQGGTTTGLFCSDSGGAANKFVGRVFQVPTASDPFLGFRLVKSPVAI